MKYMYIEKTRQGYRIAKDSGLSKHGREGMHYIGYTKREAIRRFRCDFDCIGKHFTIIEY